MEVMGTRWSAHGSDGRRGAGWNQSFPGPLSIPLSEGRTWRSGGVCGARGETELAGKRGSGVTLSGGCWHSQHSAAPSTSTVRAWHHFTLMWHKIKGSVTASRMSPFFSLLLSGTVFRWGRSRADPPAPSSLELSVTWLSHGRHLSPGPCHQTEAPTCSSWPKPPAVSPPGALFWRPFSKSPDACQVRGGDSRAQARCRDQEVLEWGAWARPEGGAMVTSPAYPENTQCSPATLCAVPGLGCSPFIYFKEFVIAESISCIPLIPS